MSQLSPTASLASLLRRDLARRLSEKRFTHVLGVEGLALVLARRWGVDQEAAMLAALLHDYMKAVPKEQLGEMLEGVTVFPVTEEDRRVPNVWHGLVAAQVGHDDFGVTNREVLQAVFYHTTGVEGMGPVGICLYVADTLEPTRHFPGVEEMRRLILGLPMIEAAYRTSKIKLDLLLHKHGTVHRQTARMNRWLAEALPQSDSGRTEP